MKHVCIILSSLLMIISTSFSASSEPKGLSEHQMTDLSVDDTISGHDNDKKNEETSADKKNTPPSSDVVNIIKNPVDDPAELNKAEVFRLENQAAEQRVNDQIRDSLKGIPPQD